MHLHSFHGIYLLLTGLILAGPVAAQDDFYQNDAARKRRELTAQIEAGVPADSICLNAKVYAGTSSVPEFTKWAMQVARKYCDPGELGSPGKAPLYPDAPSTTAGGTGLAIPNSPQSGCMMVINGWRPRTCGSGPNLMLGP